MTGGSAVAGENPPGSAGLALLQDAARYLAERAPKIAEVLARLDQSAQDPSLLEETFRDPQAQDHGDSARHSAISIADYCFRIAGECREKMRSIETQLSSRKSDWTDHKGALEVAFTTLRDMWSTYKAVLDDLAQANWGGDIDRSSVLRGLRDHRRDYIRALEDFQQPLFVAQGCVAKAVNPRS
jgi:hypothetical protein